MDQDERLLRKREVAAMLNIDPSSLMDWVKQGRFPAPIVLNPDQKRSLLAWRKSVVDAWIASRPSGTGRAPHPNLYAAQRRIKRPA